MSATTTRPVIVAMDGSKGSLTALRWAAKEALSRKTPLRLFHACQFGDGGEDFELLLEHVYRWNRHAAGLARMIAPGVAVDVKIRLGPAVDLLRAESSEASMLVLAGPAAATVAAEASCPVVVVRGPPRTRGPIVVGVDGSEPAEQALRFALDAASARGVPLDVVHAWHDAGFLRVGVEFLTRVARERHVLEDRIAGWVRKYPELEITADTVQDRRPSNALLRAVPAAQLIVVGGRAAGQGGSLGPIGDELLAHALCPVAVVR
jgi:nucleotide-binding universal stress UspA family protein